MGFKYRADKISYTLPTTRHRCIFEVWALAQSHGDGHRSLVTPKRILSKYNEGFILFWIGKKDPEHLIFLEMYIRQQECIQNSMRVKRY